MIGVVLVFLKDLAGQASKLLDFSRFMIGVSDTNQVILLGTHHFEFQCEAECAFQTPK